MPGPVPKDRSPHGANLHPAAQKRTTKKRPPDPSPFISPPRRPALPPIMLPAPGRAFLHPCPIMNSPPPLPPHGSHLRQPCCRQLAHAALGSSPPFHFAMKEAWNLDRRSTTLHLHAWGTCAEGERQRGGHVGYWLHTAGGAAGRSRRSLQQRTRRSSHAMHSLARPPVPAHA